tara:strand:- start:327 stop:659 length:333 start_codon:yes stop_codon:yes gene_type:complete
MNKKLVKYFVKQFKEDKEWEKKVQSKFKDMNDHFKYSGKIEKQKSVYQFESYRSGRFVYDENSRCHTLHEIIINKKKKNEKDKENSNRLIKKNKTKSWRETENYIPVIEI